MPREELQATVLSKLQAIQKGKDEPVWISGRQITELLPKHNPSSVRMALLLLHDRGLVVRERRKGRGKKGKTGQSAWYSLANNPTTVEKAIGDLRDYVEAREQAKAERQKRIDTYVKESV